MRFRRSPRLADSHNQRGFEPIAKPGQNRAHAIGVDVVEEMERETSTRVLQSTHHQHRPQTTATDTDPENVGEWFSAGGLQHPAQHILAELLDLINFLGNVVPHRSTGGELG